MPKTAVITEALAVLRRSGGSSLCLLQEGPPFEDVWSYVKTRKDWQDWNGLGVCPLRLQGCLDSLTTRAIEEHVDIAKGMDFFTHLQQSDIVENDRVFQWDVKYVLAFIRMLADRQDLGHPDAFWETWSRLNEKAMQNNLRPLWYDYDQQRDVEQPPLRGEPSTAMAHLLDERGHANPKAAHKHILKGAEYRCKRNYAAFVRELYTIMSLTEKWVDADNDMYYEPCQVFWHPALDMVCKCDALVIPPDYEKMGLVGLAVHLKSRASHRHATQKQMDVPQVITDQLHHMLSVGIPIDRGAMLSHKVILPDAYRLTLLRRALAGDRASMHMLGHHYYHRNDSLFQNV